MFKNLLVIILLMSSLRASSMEDMRIEYRINFDTLDPHLSPGMTTIEGHVYNSNGDPLSDAMVSTSDFIKQTTTDFSGFYSFEVSDKDSTIFAYRLNYTEVIIPNYDFKSQHIVSIDFFLMENIVPEVNLKPVVYAYGDIENVSIQYDFKTELTFSYPAYQESWEFTSTANGDIIYDGKSYPYLFWEGENWKSDYSSLGADSYLVKTDTIIQHLENVLTTMNLNNREKTDFITFWGPKISQKEYAILQFLNDDEYDEMIAEISVNPKPQNMLRFYLLFTPLDYPIPNYSTKSPEFEPISREGFTLIEWGGSEIPLQNTWLNI